MEIPYIVEPRKDTGLFNSKIAIWLFLASEVMLFGGFFSAYIFLRIGADYPWPERTLPVLPGLINTFILIASSVTVVFAWAALKLGEWRKFQVYMSITLICAVLFMGFKAVEYYVKLHHQAVRLVDYSVVEGHLGYEKDENHAYIKDHKGKKIEENVIRVASEAGSKITYKSERFYAPWVEKLIAQAERSGAKLTLTETLYTGKVVNDTPEELFAKDTELSVDVLKTIKKDYITARTKNQKLRTAGLRDAWKIAHKENSDKKDYEIQKISPVQIDEEAFKGELLIENASVSFALSGNANFHFKRRDIQEGPTQSKLRDDTIVYGALQASPMNFHHVDAIDFQHLVMKAEERGMSPEVAIKNSWLMQNSHFVQEIWAWHEKNLAIETKRLLEKGGLNKKGEAKLVPTHKQKYRIGWQEMAKYGQSKHSVEISSADEIKEQFMGPNYTARGDETFPHLTIPHEQILLESKFAPAWNTYYAIYFTITGLHGLHVIGGALVLAYYLFFGRKMYLSNPEWLANRVEVGGLFWHFVDLVWIFAFPILYLM